MSAPSPDPESARSRGQALRAGAVVVAVVAVVARLYRLDDLPGEWYGDISTLYEVAASLRAGGLPPGFFLLGIGPLYPELLRPALWLLGDSYYTFKLTSVAVGLAGLWIVHRLASELFGRTVGLAAVAVASLWTWWLVFSRLGDQQPLNPVLSGLTVLFAVFAVRRPDRAVVWAAACGSTASLGLYLYANSFVLPLLGAAIIGVAAVKRRLSRGAVVAFVAAGACVALPIVVETLGEWESVRGGHSSRQFGLTGWWVPDLLRGVWSMLGAYVRDGDPIFRSNAGSLPHIDFVSAVAVVIGVVTTLASPRLRQRGLLLAGAAALLHVPALLTGPDQLPSAGRTLGAAPFVAVLAGVGVVAFGRAISTRWSTTAAVAIVAALVAVSWTINLNRYFATYEDGLPEGNLAIAREITRFVDEQPPGTEVHLVGGGWAAWSMPEPKSVIYAVTPGRSVVEQPSEHFDCDALRSVPAGSIVVWSPFAESPATTSNGDVDASCTAMVDSVQVHRTSDGRPLFSSGTVGVS